MANQNSLNDLQAALQRLDKVDIEKLLRKDLGVESLERGFLDRLEKIQKLQRFVSEYAPLVFDEYVGQAASVLNQIAEAMTAQAARTSSEYINQRANFITQVDNQLLQSDRWKSHFIAAAIEQRGFLEDEGIKQAYSTAISELQRSSEATLANVKNEADKALDEARRLADEIENKARRTAAKISMQETQRQFQEAAGELAKKVRNWRIASFAATGLLVLAAWAFAWWPLPGNGDWPVALYHTVIRIFVLTAVGAISAFTFKMLRAHMHMAEKNLHRVRVANSAESFVNAALEPQQRDLLLAKIAEAIIDFGDSGIIKGDHEHESGVLSADLLGRILAAVTTKR